MWTGLSAISRRKGRKPCIWTDLKLTEVAAAAGYGDSRMLSVIFRRVTGETPSGFRKKHRAESPTDW